MSSSVSKHQEVILRVISPVLTNSSSISLTSQVCAGNSTWDVTLLQQDPKLAVAVVWNRRDHRDMTGYNAMYVIPHQAPGKAINRVQVDAPKFSAGQAVACSFNVEKAKVEDQYSFDIVFSSKTDPSYFLQRNDLVLSPAPKNNDLVLSPAPKSNELILTLLKDPASVDVAFMFTSDKAFSGVGLWAHSAVLSRYKVFEELIQHGKAIKSSTTNIRGKKGVDGLDAKVNIDSDLDSYCKLAGRGDNTADFALSDATATSLYDRAIVIEVNKVSLKTMCTLLYYIYTSGTVDRSVKLGRFAISRRVVNEHTDDPSDAPMLWCDTEGRFDGSHEWHPLEHSSPWKLRDVSWDELLEVATLSQLSDLQALCRVGVIDRINESNAVDVLFGTSATIDPEIKEAAMMTIVKNMGTLLDEDKDPFLPYRDRPDLPDLLIQIMRLKVKDN